MQTSARASGLYPAEKALSMLRLMRRRIVGIFVLLWACPAAAHPGIGIVQDSRGNVFFTDLKQVWKIALDGSLSVAVRDVHTHELYLDAEDKLYGEHLWYDGSQWHHKVWSLKGRTLQGEIPARAGVPQGYSFVRDRAGNMYWAEVGEKPIIKTRSPDGKTVTHAAADFRDVERMTVTADGTLFLIDAGDLRRVSPAGEVTTVATKLSAHKPPPASVSERHYHMGLWLDKEGSIYVAVARERLVLRVDSDGKREVVARSGEPWSPSGGMFDREGNLWLLEYDSSNEVRVRRLDRNGKESIYLGGTKP